MSPALSTRPQSPNIDRAKVLISEGNFDEARIAFETAGLKTPPEPGSHLGAVALAAAQGDMDAAIEALAHARRAGHESDIRRTAPWLVAVLDGKVRGGRTKHLLASDGESTGDGLKQDGISEAEAGLYRRFKAGEFSAILAAVEKKEQRSLVETRLLADSYWNMSAWTKAVPLYRQLLRSQPNDDAVTLQLADSLIRLKRFDEGILFLQILADSHPEKPGYWKMLGDAGRQKGDRALAIQAYTTAIERGHKDEMLPSIVQELMKASDSSKNP